MERFLQQYNREYMSNKEYMKMAILRHEEMFKEQVNELHRLYRVQKLLMKDLKTQQNPAHDQNHSSWLHHGGHDDSDGHGMNDEVVQESDIELTLATGGSRRKKKKEEASLTSDSGESPSSSSTGSGGETLKLHQWGLFQMPAEMNKSFPGEKRSGFNMEEGMRQDRVKQPSWHFQCLSLKMT